MPELVVIAEQLFAAVPGGTGRYTEQLLPALAATAPPGWTVSTVVCRHADVAKAQVEGVDGPRVLPLPRKALTALWQYGGPYWPGGDAVHAPTPFAPPFKPRGKTLTVTVHDTVPWTHPETLTPRGVRWHRSTIARAARTADAVVVPTHAVATDLAARVDVKVPVEVIPHAAAAIFAAPQPRAGAQDSRPEEYLLAVGTLEPRKGIDVLIAAVGVLHRRGTRAPPLLLAGPDGWGGLNPRELAAEQGLPPGAVQPLGRIADAALAAVVQGAHAVVVPSLAEGFGLPVLEAMSAGVPVVHSDAAALVEVAADAGITVPRGNAEALADALHALHRDPLRRAQLSAAGRHRAAEFSWQRAAESLWRLHADGTTDGRTFTGS